MSEDTPAYPDLAEAAAEFTTAAADEIRKAREINDALYTRLAEAREAGIVTGEVPDLEERAAARSVELAHLLTALAAIRAGLPPCCHHARPEPGREAP